MESAGANVAASGDPFYVFKEELETKVSAVNQKYSKWKSLMDPKAAASLMKDLPLLTDQIERAVAAAEKSLKFLEQTIVVVEANRQKFEHIDNTEISSRKGFVSSTRMELMSISSEISSDAVKTRIQKEERKQLLKPVSLSPQPRNSQHDANTRFLQDETQRQTQLMQEQDQHLDGLSQSVTHLGSVAVEINNEIQIQNKMLDDLSEDVDDAQDRLTFVMDKMGKLLKTKDKCQLGLILVLTLVLVVMVVLVIYT